jgi:hypothetical protein
MTRARLTRAVLLILLAVTTGAALSGCASVGVKPWERDILSRPGMTPGDDAFVSACDEHIYFSKEASTGGLGSGGGGCGCN